MMKQEWNAALYDARHAFVSRLGESLVELLRPEQHENILDLGCGTGDLAAVIAASGARVTGIDKAPSMIQSAQEKFPDIRFEIGSASGLSFRNEFDAVFSNATLHWVLEKEQAATCMFNCLKPGGRLVLEMGGKGNVQHISSGLRAALKAAGYTAQAETPVWYFPSLSEYTSLLEQKGFRVIFAAHFDRPTELQGENGIVTWILMFGAPFFKDVPEEDAMAIATEVEEKLRPQLFRNSKWMADYVRLRIEAIKPA